VIYDYTLGWLPFPSVYLLFILLVLAIVLWIRAIRQKGFLKGLLSLAIFLVLVVSSFYLLWGFNYKSESLSQKLELNIDSLTISKADLEKEIMDISALAIATRPDDFRFPVDTENELRVLQEQLLAEWNLPTYGRVRVRQLRPKGILLRLATAGVYIPFAMEGHIDAGLHPVQQPATMAHEMAHGYGITDEGTCNFIGFLSCLASDNKEIKYSGYILFRYLLSNYRRYYRDDYSELLKHVAQPIIDDLVAIGKEHDKYPDLMPKARDIIYDNYLKSHGISDGLKNYSTIIQMVAAWKESGHNPELRERLRVVEE
jgi:hypothetical protein